MLVPCFSCILENCREKKSVLHPRGAGGGYSGLQVIGMIEWGKNGDLRKSLGLKTPPLPKKKENLDQHLTPPPPPEKQFPESIK